MVVWAHVYFITFRLNDSLPRAVIEKFKQELKTLPGGCRFAAKREYLEERIAQGAGQCILKNRSCAEIVRRVLIEEQKMGYQLLSWVIMANHVHVVANVAPTLAVSDLVRKWKLLSTYEINRCLGRGGVLWLKKSYSRYMRGEDHFFHTLNYVRKNVNEGAVLWFTPSREQIREMMGV